MSSGEESQSKKRKLEETEEKETQGDQKSVDSVDAEVENSQIGGEQIEQEINIADRGDLVLPMDVCHLTQLPDELVLKVLSKLFFLDEVLVFPYADNQLLYPIASSCRRLRELFFSESLWRRVCIFEVGNEQPTFQLSSDFFAILSRMANAIHQLDVRYWYSYWTGFRQFFPRFPHLANVTKLMLSMDNSTVRELRLFTRLCPAVTSLHLTNVTYLNDRLLNLINSRWPNLVEISLSRCSVDNSTYSPVQFVTVFNKLQAVDIDFYYVTDSEIDQLARVFNRSLRSISFSSQIKLSGSAVRSIVLNSPLVEKIQIERTTDDLSDLKSLSNLKRLILSLNRFNCTTLSECFSGLFSHLRYFNLGLSSDIDVTDLQLEQIASSCPSLEYLRLDVRDSHASDAGVIEIVNKCRNLRELRLMIFPLMTERSFIGAAQKLPNLKRLALAGAENLDENVLRDEFANTKGLEIQVWLSVILST